MTNPEGRNAPSQAEQFEQFMTSVDQGQPVPEVDPTELRRFHERMIEHTRDLRSGTAIGLSGLALDISPTQVGPLWLRYAFLGFLANQGLLAEWQHGTELDDVAFRVAATIPLNGLDLDPEAFVTRLRAETLHD